ncbi:MAG TPA: BON domain-containing protein [Pyrinomonadaceae bacterium]|nr:BON domain-containing protein [Pyrinomonadaceae bacterium]
MAYDEEHARRSRVVVETPSERREVVQSQEVRTPDRSGVSAGMVGVLVVVAIALITILVLFWMNNQSTTDPNANLTAQQTQPPTTIVQQPAQQPPVIIQQPAPVTQPAPVIISPAAPAGGTTMPANQDASVQMAIDKKIADDPTLSQLGITATVMDGKVTLLGTVKTESLKQQVEQALQRIKGVKSIDNQITVMS